jgi:hypothetical protein
MAKATSPTSAQLRLGIASGQAGDKISNIDPAAAPLGIDDEAGQPAHAAAISPGRGP